MEIIVLILKIILLTFYYLMEAYIGIICLYFLLGWFPKLRFSNFYLFLEKLAYPFMRIFSGKIVIGMFDLSATLGILVIEYLLSWLYRLVFLF